MGSGRAFSSLSPPRVVLAALAERRKDPPGSGLTGIGRCDLAATTIRRFTGDIRIEKARMQCSATIPTYRPLSPPIASYRLFIAPSRASLFPAPLCLRRTGDLSARHKEGKHQAWLAHDEFAQRPGALSSALPPSPIRRELLVLMPLSVIVNECAHVRTRA
jgi:hypothetical protein